MPFELYKKNNLTTKSEIETESEIIIKEILKRKKEELFNELKNIIDVNIIDLKIYTQYKIISK